MNIFRQYSFNIFNATYNVCTCGYCEKDDCHTWERRKECPKCGTKLSDLSWRKLRSKKIPIVVVEKAKIEDKNFEIIKVRYLTEVNTENELPTLTITEKEVWHTTFDFMDNCKLEIERNGEKLNNTKTNVQKALSHVDLTKSEKEDTLFRSMMDFSNETTSSGIVFEILNNPFVEIFYNTYGNLKVVKNIPLFVMDRTKTVPNEILGLNKPVWKEMLSINKEMGCEINKHFNQIKSLDDANKNKPDYTVGILKYIPELGIKCFDDYVYLIQKGFDYKRLYQYLTDDIYTYQGISDIREGLTLLKDYINMCETMGVPYEKYPKSLKLAHDLASKNLEIKVNSEQQELFNEVINKDDYKELEYKGTYYSVINPKTTDDIVNEGRYLHHCVWSYVNTVIKGITKILFFRNNDDINKPLITLEVRDGVLRQYKGRQNRRPNNIEMDEIIKWANLKGLSVW